MKERDLSLDVIRIFACILVVFMHSPIPSANANAAFLAGLSFLTAPCIGLFFMVSGALLLPLKIDYFAFLKRRLSKVVIPTLIWTAIYLGLKIYFSESEINILQSVASVPFSAQGHGVLWFMYTLIGLYLLTPILSRWVVAASDKEIKFVLLLWGITLCYPLLSFGVTVNTSTTGILYYFTGYAGYFLLGYTLKYNRIKIPRAPSLFVTIIGIFLLIILKRFNIEFDFYALFWYESIFIAALCCVYWISIKRWVDRWSKRFFDRHAVFVHKLSALSFGIYFIHILIMRYGLWNIDIIRGINNYPFQAAVIAIITLVISFVVCSWLSRFSMAKWVIGCTQPIKK